VFYQTPKHWGMKTVGKTGESRSEGPKIEAEGRERELCSWGGGSKPPPTS